MAKRRVVVTGMGAVTPIGLSVDEFWQNVKAQKTGFSEITKFDTTNYKCKLAAEVKVYGCKRSKAHGTIQPVCRGGSEGGN